MDEEGKRCGRRCVKEILMLFWFCLFIPIFDMAALAFGLG